MPVDGSESRLARPAGCQTGFTPLKVGDSAVTCEVVEAGEPGFAGEAVAELAMLRSGVFKAELVTGTVAMVSVLGRVSLAGVLCHWPVT